MFLLTECAVPEDIHTQHPFMASLRKFQIKVSGRESSNREKTSMWGMNLLLTKTMSEKSLITKQCLRSILPFGKFCNLDCLAS